MSDYTDVKAAVNYYLQSNFPSAASPISGSGSLSDVTTAMDTLILLACNNARRWAELKHDFRLNDVTVGATLPSTGLGVLIEGLTDVYSVSTYDLKTIKNVWRTTTAGTKFPVRWMTRDQWVADKMDIQNKRGWDASVYGMERYPSDGLAEANRLDNQCLVLIGNRLVMEPPNTEAITLVIDGQKWMSDYVVSTNETDFLIKRGKAFFIYAAICEANMLIQRFVPRQEGSLPPPTAERDKEFAALMDWDNFAANGRDLITE